MTSNKQPTAAMIVIGNEVLSGRTKDKNIDGGRTTRAKRY